MEEVGIDAAAVVGADWCLIDPEAVDGAVERYRQRSAGEGAHRLTFVHAPPGMGTVVIERTLMRELAEKGERAGIYATIGAMLGYIPIAPVSDPIARAACVAVDPLVRDAQYRFIPDSEPRRAALVKALAAIQDLAAASSAEIAAAVRVHQQGPPVGLPQEIVLELCTGRATSGPRGAWVRGSSDSVERPAMTLAGAEKIFREVGESREDGVVTLAGAGDPLNHPELLKIVAAAKRAGIAAVHVRTDLVCEAVVVESLLDAGIDVISVDVMAESPGVYRRLMGADLFDRVRWNLQRLIEGRQRRATAGGLPVPWIVARITRCDANYEEIEPFFDRWLLGAGSAVIDPLPAPVHGERIEPLPVPEAAARRMTRERMVVLSDGRVPACGTDLSGERCVGDVLKEGVTAVWRRLTARRVELVIEARPERELSGGVTRARVASPTAGL
jgi:hypothetical protein